jgi:LuxR family maltose regulon positive regulatory protein
MFYWLEVPHVTRCRVLIAQGSAASLQEADETLQFLEQLKEARHNTRQLIELLMLQAMLHQKQGQTGRALAALEHALTLAHPGGLIRPFVELGPTMAGLLEQLHRDGVATDYVERILAALQTEDEGRRTQGADPSLVLRPLSLPAGDATGGLVETLTNRELEVLELMAQRLTNKEIAAQLVISVGTVKQHAYNINQKLNVRGRRQAVAKATSLGILSTS